MPVKILPASGSGSATLVSVAGTTTNDTLTLPARTGNIITSADTGTVTGTMLASATVAQSNLASNVAGNGPAFLARLSADQIVTSTVDTIVAHNTEIYDIGGRYNNTNTTVGGIPAYSFLPNVPGYYLIYSTMSDEPSTSPTRFINSVTWNASQGYRLHDFFSAGPFIGSGSVIIYFNGTTDYVYNNIYVAASTARIAGGSLDICRFGGCLIRSA